MQITERGWPQDICLRKLVAAETMLLLTAVNTAHFFSFIQKHVFFLSYIWQPFISESTV